MADMNKEEVKKRVRAEFDKRNKRNVYDEDAVIAPYKEYDIDDVSDKVASNIYTAINGTDDKKAEEIKKNGWEAVREYIHELNDQSNLYAPYKELNIDDVADDVAAKIYTAVNKKEDGD